MSDAAALRLRRRYPPPRMPRPVLVGLVALGAAVGMTWLIWAALFHADPVVTADVPAFEITSDTSMSVTITVQRPDPSIPVSCRVVAQATDFQPVAEKVVQVPASTVRLANIPVQLTTLRRATSASVSGCTAG